MVSTEFWCGFEFWAFPTVSPDRDCHGFMAGRRGQIRRVAGPGTYGQGFSGRIGLARQGPELVSTENSPSTNNKRPVH